MDTNTITVAEAARRLGVSKQTVRRLITAGHLRARRLTPAAHSVYRIDPASLDAYIKQHQPG